MPSPKLINKVGIVSILSIAALFVHLLVFKNISSNEHRDLPDSRDDIVEITRRSGISAHNSSISLQLETFMEQMMRNITTQISMLANVQDRILNLSKELEYSKDSLKNLETKFKIKQSVIAFLAQPTINDFNYSYIHNPIGACANSSVEVLIVVPSAAGHFKERLKARKGYRGEFVMDPNNRTVLLFFIGSTDSLEVQGEIDNESMKYGDIVQQTFQDVYKNIRLKALSMLKWASTFCQQTRFVLRTDDDIKADLTQVMSVLRRGAQDHEEFILGKLRKEDHPTRNKKSKYSLSDQQYPNTSFPPYALGGLLGYPLSSVQLLYQAALRVKPIWLDDVYITGICAPKVGVELLTDSAFDFIHKSW